MHLPVPGAVAHFYQVQRALAQVREDRNWLSLEFHLEIYNWEALVALTVDWPTQLAEIFS